MIDGMFTRGPLPALEAAMRFGQQRHLVLVNNLANATTHGFRARDVNLKAFQQMLAESINASERGETRGIELRSTDGFSAEGGKFVVETHEVFSGSMGLDRNTVVFEREMSKLLKNGLHMQALGRLVDRSYRRLEEAWRGRIR